MHNVGKVEKLMIYLDLQGMKPKCVGKKFENFDLMYTLFWYDLNNMRKEVQLCVGMLVVKGALERFSRIK